MLKEKKSHGAVLHVLQKNGVDINFSALQGVPRLEIQVSGLGLLDFRSHFLGYHRTQKIEAFLLSPSVCGEDV